MIRGFFKYFFYKISASDYEDAYLHYSPPPPPNPSPKRRKILLKSTHCDIVLTAVSEPPVQGWSGLPALLTVISCRWLHTCVPCASHWDIVQVSFILKPYCSSWTRPSGSSGCPCCTTHVFCGRLPCLDPTVLALTGSSTYLSCPLTIPNELGQGRSWDRKWGWGVQKWWEHEEIFVITHFRSRLSRWLHLWIFLGNDWVFVVQVASVSKPTTGGHVPVLPSLVVAFSSLAKILRECLTIYSLPALFFFFFWSGD